MFFFLIYDECLPTIKMMCELSLITPQVHRVAIKNTNSPVHIKHAALDQKSLPENQDRIQLSIQKMNKIFVKKNNIRFN